MAVVVKFLNSLKMRLIILISIAIALVFVAGCNTGKDESSYVNDFKNNEVIYDSLANYITSKFINTNEGAGKSKKIILICGQTNVSQKGDNRYCDTFLEPKMKELGISVINIEKNICFKDKNFDLISFELSSIPQRDETIYYHYSLCPEKETQQFESSHVKIIPLKKAWSVFIEKD